MKTIWVFISLFRGPWDCEEELTIEPWRLVAGGVVVGAQSCVGIGADDMRNVKRSYWSKRALKAFGGVELMNISNGSTDEHVIAPGIFLMILWENNVFFFLNELFFSLLHLCCQQNAPPGFLWRNKALRSKPSTIWNVLCPLDPQKAPKVPNFQVWSVINNMEPLMTWARCWKKTTTWLCKVY